jgi:hypothetical protein
MTEWKLVPVNGDDFYEMAATFRFAFDWRASNIEEAFRVALAAAPEPPANLPVAWMAEDGRVVSDATRRDMLGSIQASYCRPLYALPPADEKDAEIARLKAQLFVSAADVARLKAENERLQKELDDALQQIDIQFYDRADD